MIKSLQNSQIKSTIWQKWLLEIKVPEFINGDFADTYFAIENKAKKPIASYNTSTKKDSSTKLVEEKQEIILIDDKRSRNLSILLSRFSLSYSEVFRILDQFETNILQYSKDILNYNNKARLRLYKHFFHLPMKKRY